MRKSINFELNKKRETLTKNLRCSKSLVSLLLATALLFVLFFSFLLVSTSVQATQISELAPQFTFDVSYAYVAQGPTNDSYIDSMGNMMQPESQYPSAIYFNVTRSPDAEPISYDAMLEVYLVTLTTDKGPVENFAYFEGTNYLPSFSDDALMTITDHIYDLIDLNAVNGVRGHFCFNWTKGEAFLSPRIGSAGSYCTNPSKLGLWSAGQPNTISMEVSRIGYVTITNGVVSIIQETTIDSELLHTQLSKNGDSFLDNELISADKLLQINPFDPISDS
jgi:hypothetical protein